MFRPMALSASALLAACVTPEAPVAQPAKTPVALGQSVLVGDVTISPVAIVEDSRCPADARCVWAGRLVVRARLRIADWQDTIDIELGKNYDVHGRGIALISAKPEKSPVREITAGDYRFKFDKAWYVTLGASRASKLK